MLPEPNLFAIIMAAFIPLIIGFIYYNPKVMGEAWMKASGMSEEKMQGGNMLVIFGSSLLLSFLMSFILVQMVIHQTSVYSLFQGKEGMGVEGSEASLAIDEIMRLAGDNFRTFKHGALHGTFVGLFIVFPVFGTNIMFERRPFKLALINSLYWTICLALMGGVLCQYI